jgi:hypothetical protein
MLLGYLYAFFAAAYTTIVAFRRKAVHRTRIALIAFLLPLFFDIFGFVMALIGEKLGAPDRAFLWLLLLIAIIYFGSSIGVIIWAHQSKSVLDYQDLSFTD